LGWRRGCRYLESATASLRRVQRYRQRRNHRFLDWLP